MTIDPSTLRLPFWAAYRFRLEELLVQQLDCPWSEAWRLREVFALSGPELAFARVMLDRRRNLWLYRCNQRHYCGDFVAVDMSAPAAKDRRAYAIELKAGEEVRVGVGGRQFVGLGDAVAELRAVIGDGVVITAQGDGDAIVKWIGR